MADLRVTGQLDDFNRPNESPLSGGGNWGNPFTAGTTGQLSLVDGDAATTKFDGFGLDYSYWTPDIYPVGDVEVWGAPVGGEAGAALSGWRMGFMMANSIPGTSWDGYLFLRESAISDFIYFRRYDNASPTDLAWSDPINMPYTDDYQTFLLARRVGNDLEAWVGYDANNWTLIGSTTEGTYHGPWKIFIGVEDGTDVGTGWDTFGGGLRPRRQQIYRVLQNTGLPPIPPE